MNWQETKRKEIEEKLTKIFDGYSMASEVDGRYSPVQWIAEVMSLMAGEVDEAEQRGRKQIMDWIKAHSIYLQVGQYNRHFDDKECQAFLKGVEK